LRRMRQIELFRQRGVERRLRRYKQKK
jgi:hypothetical protein